MGNELAPSAIAKCQENEQQWVQAAATNSATETAAIAVGSSSKSDKGGAHIKWVQGDMLQAFSGAAHASAYDVVFDCQVFHVMRSVDEQAFTQLVQNLLAPGGLYITIAGNAHEAARNPGPPVLTAAEVISPFEAVGLQLLRLQRTTFAPTASYGASPPLAWLAVFVKAAGSEVGPLGSALHR